MSAKKLISIIILSFAAGVFAGSTIWKTDSSPSSPEKETALAQPEGGREERAAEYVFPGEGRGTVGPAKLSGGLVFLRAKNLTGVNDYFGVTVTFDENADGVLDSGEGWTGVGVNVAYEEAETYDRIIPFKAAEGDYYASVEGGRWEISFIEVPPLGTNAPEESVWSGEGYAVTDTFFLPEGNFRFRVQSDSGLSLRLFDEMGNASDYLVSATEGVDTEVEYKNVFAGNYIFVADTGGPWRIEKVGE